MRVRFSPDDPADAAAMDRHAATLADAIVEAIPGWVRRSILERALPAGADRDDVIDAADAAAESAVAEAEPQIRGLLEADVDEQTTTPLAILRSLVRHPNDALDHLGVPAPERPEFERETFPDDTHGLTPAAFADVDPDLHELGIVWGAAKAHIHLRRRNWRTS